MPVIRCMNLIAYIQKSIDNILCLLCTFVRAYIDNITISARLFEKYIADFQVIFDFHI